MNSPRTVLITGASRGLGLRFTAHYIRRGWRVIATARRPAAADTALGPWMLVQLDTADEASIHAAAQEIKGIPIDLLINNAGVFARSDLATTTKTELMELFAVNAAGPFLVVQALHQNLRLAARAPDTGPVIIAQLTSRLGSLGGNGDGGLYSYRATKAALNMLSASLTRDLAAEGITVVSLHPGYASTDMSSGRGDLTPEASVEALTATLERVTRADSGAFLQFDGQRLPW